MQKDSLWLGGARGAVRIAMIAAIAITAALYLWLLGNALLFSDSIGMHEMIRPQGRPVVAAMLVMMLVTITLAGIYLSDEVGAIEPHPDGFFDIFSLVLSRIAMILVAFIVIVMFYEVVSRYLFSAPTLWANELSLWIAAFVFLMAGQYAMQQRSHIRIYVIYDVMPRWMQKTSDIVSLLVIVGFAFALVWGGWNDAETRLLRMETFGTAWDPPIPGVVKPAILVLIVLVAVQAISNLIADWSKEPEHHAGDEIDQTEIENIRRTLGD